MVCCYSLLDLLRHVLRGLVVVDIFKGRLFHFCCIFYSIGAPETAAGRHHVAFAIQTSKVLCGGRMISATVAMNFLIGSRSAATAGTEHAARDSLCTNSIKFGKSDT